MSSIRTYLKLMELSAYRFSDSEPVLALHNPLALSGLMANEGSTYQRHVDGWGISSNDTLDSNRKRKDNERDCWNAILLWK